MQIANMPRFHQIHQVKVFSAEGELLRKVSPKEISKRFWSKEQSVTENFGHEVLFRRVDYSRQELKVSTEAQKLADLFVTTSKLYGY